MATLEEDIERGKSIPLLTELNGTFVINNKVYDVFKKAKEREIAVYCINGKQGTGKSFLLNYFLRYLENRDNWLDFPPPPLNEFTWGNDEHTLGILLWSKPYLIPIGDKEVALFLLDTQGCFEAQGSFVKSAIISTMSVALSSFYIYNAQKDVKDAEYMFLRLIAKIVSSFTAKNVSSTPLLESLLFLTRDWNSDLLGYRPNYPIEENGYSITKLTPVDYKTQEKQFILASIRDSFNQTDSYFMPHPGLKFIQNDNFNGSIDQNNEELVKFFESVRFFFSEVLIKKIVVKKIKGYCMTAEQFCNYIPDCLDRCTNKIREFQRTKEVLQMESEIQALTAADAVLDFYKGKMNIIMREGPLNTETFLARHKKIRSDCKSIYDAAVPAEESTKNNYSLKLKEEIESLFNEMKKLNELEYKSNVNAEEMLRLYENKISELTDSNNNQQQQLRQQSVVVARMFGKKFMYKMTSEPRGLCIMINNVEFNRNGRASLKDRRGADVDFQRLRIIFTSFHFTILERRNLSGKDMMIFLQESSEKCKLEHDALVVIISSHGRDDFIYGSDSSAVAVNDILSTFNNRKCPNLMSKPKIFFFFACRGGNKDPGVKIRNLDDGDLNPKQFHFLGNKTSKQTSSKATPETTSGIIVRAKDLQVLQVDGLPTFSDMLICYPTMQGDVSFRHPTDGTLFGEELCKVLNDYANELDLERMLKIVAQNVSSRSAFYDGKIYKQSVTFQHISLLKYIYFNSDKTDK